MAWPRSNNSRSSAQTGTQPHNGVQATDTPAPDADSPPGSGQNAGVAGTTHAVADAPGVDARFPRHDRTASRRLGPIRYAHSGMDDTPQTAGTAATAQPPGPDAPEPAEPPDEGISIFGDIATTEVTEDEEPTLDLRSNRPLAPAPQPVGSAVESKPRPFRMRIGDLRTAPAAADGQPRVAIRDLPPDVQLRFWRTRLIIMIVVGLIFGILTKSWVIGLTLAILAGIVDTLYRSRTAADHVNGASQSGAQRRTRWQLRKMRRAGYFALDARPIPNSREYIDHLVVGPSGVYAIDSEKWNSKVPVRTANGKILYRGPESQKPRLEHAVWEAGQASEILSAALGTEIVVRPALAIYGPRIPWDIATIRGVDVFTGKTLRTYLKRRGRQRDGVQKLTREEVRTIYETAARMLPDVAPTRTAAPVG